MYPYIDIYIMYFAIVFYVDFSYPQKNGLPQKIPAIRYVNLKVLQNLGMIAKLFTIVITIIAYRSYINCCKYMTRLLLCRINDDNDIYGVSLLLAE